MKNTVLRKTMENMRKHRDMKLVTTEARRNYYQYQNQTIIQQFLFGKFISHLKMKRTRTPMNKSVPLGLPILEISKIVMCQFWYHYVKPIYGEQVKLCYKDTHSFIIHINTDDIYQYILKNVETRFGTSNYELVIPLSKEKGKEVNDISLEKNGSVCCIKTKNIQLFDR